MLSSVALSKNDGKPSDAGAVAVGGTGLGVAGIAVGLGDVVGVAIGVGLGAEPGSE